MIQIISPHKLLFKYTNHNVDEVAKVLSEFTGLDAKFSNPDWVIGSTKLAPGDGYALVEYNKGFTTKNRSLSDLYTYATESTTISVNYILSDLRKLKDYTNQLTHNIDNFSDDKYQAAYAALKEVSNIINKMYVDYTGPELNVNPVPDPAPYIPPPPGDPIQPTPSPIESPSPTPSPAPSPSPVTFSTIDSPSTVESISTSPTPSTKSSKKKPPRTQTQKNRRNKKFSESRNNN